MSSADVNPLAATLGQRAADLLARCAAAWGDDAALGPDAAWDAYGADTTGATRRLLGAVRVQAREQVSMLMRWAAELQVAIHPISTGRNWGYGTALPREHDRIILDMRGMNRILDFDRDFGVVTVEPGVTQGMLAAYLEQQGLPYMVPTTGAGPDCSLMGNALERGYGITPVSDHFAAVTDMEAVLPDGTLWQSRLHLEGGARLAGLHRWGLGPYELGRFTQGGDGSVVVAMSIVLVKRPEVVQAGFFQVKDDAQLEAVVGAVHEILRDLPGLVGGINLMNRLRVLAMTVPYPRHQLGPDGLIPQDVLDGLGRQHGVAPWTGLVTLYGTGRTTAAARAEIRARLGRHVSGLRFVSQGQVRWLQRVAGWLPPLLTSRVDGPLKALAGALELIEGRPNRTALALAYWLRGRQDGHPPTDPGTDGCGLVWYAPLVPMSHKIIRLHITETTRLMRANRFEPLLTLTSLSERLFDCTAPLLFEDVSQGAERARRAMAEMIEAGGAIGSHPYRLPVNQIDTPSGIQSKKFTA